jgi:protein-disulfide isomerase
VALAAALPGAAARRSAGPRPSLGPSLIPAWGAAGAMLALFVAGQLMFPPKTIQATKPTLAQTIDMSAAADPEEGRDDQTDLSPTAQTHVVNRVVDDDEADSQPAVTAADDDENAAASTANDREASKTEDRRPIADAPQLKREMTFLDGKVRINVYDEAVLGSPEAKYVVVELMDYTCPHCRKMHPHIREAMERYGDQLAIVIMPVPLELECNKRVTATDPLHRGACKLARLALAVAKIDPGAFIDYHNFLLSDEEKPPTSSQAVVRAFHLVPREQLSKLTSSPSLNSRIEKYQNLFQTLAAQHTSKETTFGLPVQIVGDTVLTGGTMTSEEMFEAWEKELGIKPL